MKEKILEIIKEDIEKEGFEIVEIKTFRLHGRNNIRVFIDKPGGITLSDCEKATGIISFLLRYRGTDAEQNAELTRNLSDYEIEVSSPGLDRPLVREFDFVKNTGKTVMINLSEPIGDIKNYIEGKIISVKNGSVVLDSKNGERCIPIEKISKAVLKIEI
ncbi:MAG: ribosome maturation factor RimP [Elusimicrobia bacterium]|nr:ribosome maturation factor RimP [Elusimicrobiota bacterium]